MVERNKCKCGCGQIVKSGRQYINHHNRSGTVSEKKGKTFEELYGFEKTIKLKKEHSEIMKNKYKNGEMIPLFKGKTKQTDIKIADLAKKESETKLQMFKDKILIPWQIGKKKETDIRIKHQSDKLQGHQVTNETRQKISTKNTGKIGWSRNLTKETDDRVLNISKGLMGHAVTLETKNKLKEARKHRSLPKIDTLPERLLQQELVKSNIEFRKHEPILGQPDIFITPNICIFVDGCFYHSCEQCFDQNLLCSIQRGNKVNDICVTQGLINQGYIVMRFWEHDIKKDISGVVLKIKDKLHSLQLAQTEKILE